MTSYFDPETDEALDVLGTLAAMLYVSDLLAREEDERRLHEPEASNTTEMLYVQDAKGIEEATLTDIIVVQQFPWHRAIDRMLAPPEQLHIFTDEDVRT